jgi:hypothetical protein
MELWEKRKPKTEDNLYHEGTKIGKREEITKIKNFVVFIFRVFVVDSIACL